MFNERLFQMTDALTLAKSPLPEDQKKLINDLTDPHHFFTDNVLKLIILHTLSAAIKLVVEQELRKREENPLLGGLPVYTPHFSELRKRSFASFPAVEERPDLDTTPAAKKKKLLNPA